MQAVVEEDIILVVEVMLQVEQVGADKVENKLLVKLLEQLIQEVAEVVQAHKQVVVEQVVVGLLY